MSTWGGPDQDQGEETLSWIGAGKSNGASILDVPVDLVDPNPEQPRKQIDETSLQEFAMSVKSNGILQPVTVRCSSAGRYVLVMGERRWRAAKLAGLKTIHVQGKGYEAGRGTF
ncbi:MAG: ParB/RepB/Spo0J family partition protein [Elusimicrobia bacterium]|nr:ParB/RepB/Spo0J family partition protein [Elusimicrobiota bacterium]